jgi:recombinational DNA repair protein (RecF pathway)
MAIEKYTTESFILEWYERAEHDRVFKLFTREFGVVIAHAKSVRKLESKLRTHLLPGRMAVVTLVKGKEVWRIVGAEEKSVPDDFLPEITNYLLRFMRGEGVHKALFDRLLALLEKATSFDASKARVLLLYILLVDLGYADVKVIGAKSMEEYATWSIDDVYTHLLLLYNNVRTHTLLVMKDMQL